MAESIIHIPTGRLMRMSRPVDAEPGRRKERPVFDITTPSGRMVLSIRKLIDDRKDRSERKERRPRPRFVSRLLLE